jgi:hypothetical protein
MRIAPAAVLLAGCVESGAAPDVTVELVFPGKHKVDALFVIDDSTAMATFSIDYRRIGGVLEQLPGGIPDLHVAVTTADGARGGVLHGPILVDSERDGVPFRNYTGELSDAFAALAGVGAASSAIPPRPLDVMIPALATPGFLRPDGMLVVHVITASDDASAVLPSSLAAPLLAAKVNPRFVAVAVSAVPPSPRLEAWLEAFPDNPTFLTSLVDFPPEIALHDVIFLPEQRVLGDPCLAVEPATCHVTLSVEGFDDATLPRCGGTTPCWDIVEAPIQCAEYASARRIEVDHGTMGRPYRAHRIRAQCLLD